jgi:DNA-binding beta-propeller fold protein YncE
MKKALFLCAAICCLQSLALAQQTLSISGLQLLHVEGLDYIQTNFNPTEGPVFAIAAGPDGQLYLASSTNGYSADQIERIDLQGNKNLFASNIHMVGGYAQMTPALMQFGPDQQLYIIESDNYPALKVSKLTAEGEKTTLAPLQIQEPGGMTFDREGNLLVSDFYEGKIYKISPEGAVSLFLELPEQYPTGMLVDGDGVLYVVTNNHMEMAYKILQITPEGEQSVYTSLPHNSRHLLVDQAGSFFATQLGQPGMVTQLSPEGEVIIHIMTTEGSNGLAVDALGNVRATGDYRGGLYTLERQLKISERLPQGTEIAQLFAVSANDAPLTFSIAGGNEWGAYALDPATGMLQVANAAALDVKFNASHTLQLQVSDGQTTATEALTITLLEGLNTPEPVLTVEILEIGDITSTSATVLGEVQAEGIEVRQKGVVYATTPMPEVDAADVFEAGEGAGAFSATLENLSPATRYYVRAYAQSWQGLHYGEERSFTTEGVLSAPEPVEVFNLQATTLSKQVQLQWQTADVYEELLFEIERSKDGESFSMIGQVMESSPEMELKGFSFLDTAPLKGQAYYRLKIHQAYGESTYSAIVSTKSSGSKGGKGKSANTLAAWPNPVDQQRTTLASDDFQPLESLQIRLFNATGKLVMESRGQVQENGTLPLLLPLGLKKGIHLLQLNGLSGVYTLQLIIN